MPIGKLLALIALSASLTAVAGRLCAQDRSIDVPVGDARMVAAFAKARSGLDDFLEKLRHPPAGTQGYSVKIGLKDGPASGGFSISKPGEGGNEFFWIVNLRSAGAGFAGEIGNAPDRIRNVAKGQTITFGRNDIVDWMYFEGGRIRGNYTACPALMHGPRDVLEMMRKKYGLECS
jgi:uncharacterized protein YegJ (DUF2314 family)